MKRVVHRPHVWPDILAAAEWYEAAEIGLGGDLIEELEAVFTRISENPAQFPLIMTFPTVGRAVLNRFPYVIYFMDETDEIVVIAVIHSKRKARHWKRHMR